MTCGSHLAAAFSTFPRRQGIKRKKEVARNQGVKKNPRIERILVHRGWHAGPMILHRKRLDRRTLNEMARSRKKTMPERLPSGPYIPRRCGFALTRPANPRFRDAPRPGPPYASRFRRARWPQKTRKKRFDMHNGHTQNRRPWYTSNHDATSTSSAMATFLVV